MRSRSVSKALLLAALPTASVVNAHTWIEQLSAIAPNGTMVGQPGFPRGNIQRTSPQFKDTGMVFLIPPNGGPPNKIDTNQLMCRPEQTAQAQPSSDNPRLKASPGQAVALRYQENGHVTLPQNSPGKPEGSGVNFVYYTTKSKPDDKFLQVHRQWTPDGKGGDGRGRLISTQNFDDGQCYQVNDKTISKQRQAEFKHTADKYQGMELWCQQDIQIPEDAQPGTTVTLYWVWDWPTLPGTTGFPEGKQEIYTTCMDIDIVAPTPGQSKAVGKGFVKQDIANAAVPKQFDDIANPTAVKAQIIPFSGVNAATNPAASATQTTPSQTTKQVTIVPTQVNPTSTLPTPSASTSKKTLVSTQLTTSSSIPITAPTLAPVTVTVKETVTMTPTATPSSKGATPATETEVETDFITVTVTRPARSTFETITQTFNPVAVPSDSNAIADADTDADSVYTTTRCSRTAQPFLLRARNPFYIVPSQDRPTPTSTTSAGASTPSKSTSAGSEC